MSLPTAETMRSGLGTLESGRALLRELIDYAGLFPPASLSMASSVANFNAYLNSHWNWTLGRFIVPVARLDEFEQALKALPGSGEATPSWRLSVLPGSDVVEDVARIRDFNTRMAGVDSERRAMIEAVEVKVNNPGEIARLSRIVPAELETYFEFPLSSAGECISAVSGVGRRAKIRTGGETPEKFPTSADVVEFIRLCAAANVPFKATAGLHHPLRSIHRLTYEDNSPSGMMHGFLNVFLAAAFLRAGMEPALAISLLESCGPWEFSSDGIQWWKNRLGAEEIAAARKDFAISFGSCSFTEPIDDLQSLGLL
ncbi:MAG: hypothetical protein ABSD53_14410 [Terriglobales bacterium]|jgi:hypothetical protein